MWKSLLFIYCLLPLLLNLHPGSGKRWSIFKNSTIVILELHFWETHKSHTGIYSFSSIKNCVPTRAALSGTARPPLSISKPLSNKNISSPFFDNLKVRMYSAPQSPPCTIELNNSRYILKQSCSSGFWAYGDLKITPQQLPKVCFHDCACYYYHSGCHYLILLLVLTQYGVLSLCQTKINSVIRQTNSLLLPIRTMKLNNLISIKLMTELEILFSVGTLEEISQKNFHLSI